MNNTQEINIADGFRQMYCQNLNTVNPFNKTTSIGLRQWLVEDRNYYPQIVSGTSAVEISTFDTERPMICLAYDVQRLSCASFETISSLSPSCTQDKFLAWQLIQMYYAAFFAAHSILKICGMGLTQIDERALTNLKTNAQHRGNPIPIALSKGIYCVDINRNNRWMTISIEKKYDDSHHGLWVRFIDFLDVAIGAQIRSNRYDGESIKEKQTNDLMPDSIWGQYSSTDAQIVFTRLNEVRDLLLRNNKNWLSSIRNNINYGQQYGVWFPYKGLMKNHSYILSNKLLFLNDPLSNAFSCGNDSEIIQFVKVCHFIVSLNRCIVLDLSSRHPESKSFLKNGVIKYLNQHNRQE